VPDADYPARLSAFFETIQLLQRDDVLLAYHDIADGGLFATLCEMAFASRSGLAIEVPKEVGALPALFAEELGAVVQVRERDVPVVGARFAAAGIAVRAVGGPTGDARIRFEHAGATVLDETRADLHRAWSATTHALQQLRDNPTDADQEYERIADDRDPGLAPLLPFTRRKTSLRRSSLAALDRRWPCCASRASTVTSRWPRRSIAPASTRSMS